MLLVSHPKSKSVHITEDTRRYLEKKLGKLEKHFHQEPEARLVQGFERGQHIVEVTLAGDGILLRSQDRNGDLHAAIDRVVDRLETQLKRFKEKRIDNHRQPSPIKQEAAALHEPQNDGFRPVIARHKTFKMERMTPFEAIRQMELLDHGFFLFLNADTDRLAVVYRREGGDYGLIEPEI
ncbi:MAG: ribosome-associated translation inhibitor RaiA [Chloroherpetonaceae bacterium]|nr:ribosome-associated translation inhibitor RaiA [Chthonomonadaceae bacterium]MDW8206758.1 ribosome-associated translation inhibitor RaiA [Chloroherpetonaceae bacterium]